MLTERNIPGANVLNWIVGFLGGGLVSAIIGVGLSIYSARRTREVESLREQLSLLYGPLFFFTRQNEELFKLSDNVRSVYNDFFGGKNWSDDEQTQARLDKQVEATIGLGNVYIQRVVANNARMMEILERNWHLVDAADVDILARFQVDYTRYLVEVEQHGAAGLPFQIVMNLGNISFMRGDVISQVRAGFQAKRNRLATLIANSALRT